MIDEDCFCTGPYRDGGRVLSSFVVFFFQAEDGIRDVAVTGVQTCALPILLLKAAAGGGGKGMRLVREEAELEAGFEAASSEARKAFGADEIYLEKYLERPRHIEIQILADSFGRVVALGEREGSIQRRHQKLIEEAPSVAGAPPARP